MDRHNSQRELISRLISDLYDGLLTRDDIARGFAELLVSLDDMRLDTPDAHNVSPLMTLSVLARCLYLFFFCLFVYLFHSVL